MACKALAFLSFMNIHGFYYRFRWVDCQLSYLRYCLPGRIQHALDELPDTLDETYERALKDINKVNWELSHRLLQCVAVASRPLRVEELAQFLGFDFTKGPSPKFHEGWLPEDPVHAVLFTTSNLLAIVPVDGSSVIQFSHFSVKEFLTSSRLAESSDIILRRYHISMTLAHTLAAQICLGMLLHLDKNITRDDLEKFPLAEYAAEHWVDHARFEDVSGKVEDGMKLLFDPTKFHFSVWVWISDLAMEDQYWRREKRGKIPSQPRGTPLHYAALCGLPTIVKFLLIEHSQEIDTLGFDDRSTALHLACRRGHVEVVRVLLDSGADAESLDMCKLTPLHEASRGGHAELVRVLLDRGVNTKPENYIKHTPNTLALMGGHVQVVKVFIEFDVDIGVYDVDEWTPLHQALFEGNIEVTRGLLERGADLTGQDRLQAAVLGGHAGVIQVFLEHGVDLTVKYTSGSTLLHTASLGGHVEMVRILLEHGLDATMQDKNRLTPLHFASMAGHVDVARLLLEHGADVTAQEKLGWTPLHFASSQGHAEVARLLLEHGADATARESGGRTPLHYAATMGKARVAHLLLERGAEATAQDNYGQTPLDMASANDFVEVSRVLLEHGARATAQDTQ
jgi:ankyrin repeat protein